MTPSAGEVLLAQAAFDPWRLDRLPLTPGLGFAEAVVAIAVAQASALHTRDDLGAEQHY